MAKEDSKTTGTTKYKQVASGNATDKQTGADTSIRLGETQSTEKANVAFEIQFTIPLTGRYPTNSPNCQ